VLPLHFLKFIVIIELKAQVEFVSLKDTALRVVALALRISLKNIQQQIMTGLNLFENA
jgi:hypothetical protein